MAILDGFDKQKRYITDIDKNHKLVSEWTHSDTVEFADGETLTAKESDIEDRLDAAEESLTTKLGNSGVQTLDGTLLVTNGFASGERGTSRVNLLGRIIQGYSWESIPEDLILQLNGGRVYIGRYSSTDDLREVVVFKKVPTYCYDDHGSNTWEDSDHNIHHYPSPETFIPRALVTTEYRGQIAEGCKLQQDVTLDSKLTDSKVLQSNIATSYNFRVLLSHSGNDNEETDGVYKSQWLTFNPHTGILSAYGLRTNADVNIGTGIELGVASAASPSYIDFHYNTDDTSDFTSRIIAESNSTLNFKGIGGVGATLYAGAFTQVSSENVKTNIEDITDAEAKKLLQLRPVSFDYKYTNVTNQRGLIAEEVQEVYPEMVFVPDGYTEFDPERPDVVPSIDYSKFVPYLIKMIQIQQAEIDELKSKID